ncbi:hypothetical protein [uncultured Mucilaginibacter sp.]|uniref:hypothetical protein n=1 Tax=uncultured Mucilaginibacter sp. TaxID=797541 RepID=UPI002635CF13|nr:hypothetical protein [uncultured Mucilaginibacter sp.]
MEIDYIILDSNSASELELLLGEKALDGYKAVSLNSCFDPNKGITYTALMVNYGLNGQLEDSIAQILEKLDNISMSLLLIETNTGDNLN